MATVMGATGSASAIVRSAGTTDEDKGSMHRKTVRHYHEPGHLHELTFSCYRRRPLLTNDSWREELSQYIDSAAKETGMNLVAFVFMPEHVHLLVDPVEREPSLNLFLARLKQPFSKRIRELLSRHESPLLEQLTVRERPGKTCFRFWQEGPGYDRNLMTPEAIQASIGYIHNNPVRRGLCRRAVDWVWSSARFYLTEPPRRQFPRLPFVHGPPTGALD